MCGILGFSITREHDISFKAWAAGVENLLLLSESRGKEAAGIAIATDDEIAIHKDSVSAREMIRTSDYRKLIEKAESRISAGNGRSSRPLAAIGHARLVTNGLQGIDANNQPIRRDGVVLIHNGIVVNVDDIWADLAKVGIVPHAEVDSEVIAALIQKALDEGASPAAAVSQSMARIYGETSIAVFLQQFNVMILATNTGSLHLAHSKGGSGFLFTSESGITARFCGGDKAIAGFGDAQRRQLKAGEIAVLDIATGELSIAPMQSATALATPAVSPMLAVQRRIEDKSERYRMALTSMRRCSKCLLPESMPFIAYDAEGVCNYCHSYKPWVHKPENEIADYLRQRRSKDGSPDCVVAFSGGRDSSYGLHLLKSKYDMTPICFSYDWGMVTDLARRNQARMCGKLGVEHIWISADIKKKRDNIRRNVSAWLKKPDLGLIPLFMAGDKQFFWHAKKTIEATGINLSVFCTNRLEKTDFKTGYLGIPPADAEMRNSPSTMPLGSKLGLAWNYGRRFLSNPAYLNRSIPDTLFAAFSYYGIEQEHLFMFDYLKWDEQEINRTLIEGYDWELASDTSTTWRIGDGTAPFYNYIYYTVAGFTEADTFRSNQIREGMLDRERALSLIADENQPRWKSIREYTQMINIDFDETIRRIDRIPKLYARS